MTQDRPRNPKAATHTVAAFADADGARRGETALLAAGVDEAAVTVAGAGTAPARAPAEREERFLGRLVLIVAAWSTVGAVVGVAMGVAFNALEIGPGGRAGFVIQVATWAIFAHMIAGMWAGYGLLTKGESREAAVRIHDGRAVVSVRCANAGEVERAHSALHAAGAQTIVQYDADGQRRSSTEALSD